MSALEFFNLTDWFNNTFSDDEKNILFSCPSFLEPAGTGMVCGSQFLSWTLMWYSKKDNSEIVLKVFNKIIELYLKDKYKMNDLDLHFFYSNIISNLYKFRDLWAGEYIPDLCEQSINLAPKLLKSFEYMPEHVGYNTLIAIEKKAKNWPRVLELSRAAMEQGWAGKYSAWAAEAEGKL